MRYSEELSYLFKLASSRADKLDRKGVMPVNLLVFGMPEYRRDFRRYLMGAAERSGGMALHVLCKDKLVVSWAGAERAEYSANGDSNELRQLIRDRLQPGPILGLTGLGATRLDEPGVVFASNLHNDLTRRPLDI